LAIRPAQHQRFPEQRRDNVSTRISSTTGTRTIYKNSVTPTMCSSCCIPSCTRPSSREWNTAIQPRNSSGSSGGLSLYTNASNSFLTTLPGPGSLQESPAQHHRHGEELGPRLKSLQRQAADSCHPLQRYNSTMPDQRYQHDAGVLRMDFYTNGAGNQPIPQPV